MNDKKRYHAKLSNEQIEKVKEYLLDGRIKQEWIAKQFGVAQCTIAYWKRKFEDELLN